MPSADRRILYSLVKPNLDINLLYGECASLVNAADPLGASPKSSTDLAQIADQLFSGQGCMRYAHPSSGYLHENYVYKGTRQLSLGGHAVVCTVQRQKRRNEKSAKHFTI